MQPDNTPGAGGKVDGGTGGSMCGEHEASGPSDPPGNRPQVLVDAETIRRKVGPELLGANVNKWFGHAQGLWNPQTDSPDPDATDKLAQAGLGLLRHPGGTVANLFDWKRTVGPARSCQTDASTLRARRHTSYGPSEFMALVRAAGAEPQIMVPFANESPRDAADWVEYMNAPVGTNPNGGTAWALVRQADGATEPFNVTRWEIGNEHDRGGHQSYWMEKSGGPSPTPADSTRLSQYIDGAEIQFVDQPMGRDCDFAATTTTNAPGQTFYLLYGLIKAGTWPRVTVGGQLWTRVASLSQAGPADQVFEVDRERGSISFGDGTNGAIPPAGQEVRATYTFHHEGFVAMYDAMKATAAEIGVEIDVCSTWAPPAARGTDLETLGRPSFPAAMKSRGLADRYDCVVMHPYTNFSRDFGQVWQDADDAYRDHMLGDRWSRTMVADLATEVRDHSAPGEDGEPAYVAISEFGALWFGNHEVEMVSRDNVPAYSSTMMHALFMASQWVHFARLGVRWAEGNTVVGNPNGLRGVLGGSSTGFVYGAEAMTREALAPAFQAGSRWLRSRVEGQTWIDEGALGRWPALVVGATLGADGALHIIVVNRRRAVQEADIDVAGYTLSTDVEITRVTADAIDSYESGSAGDGDDPVHLERTALEVQSPRFTVPFPPASVSVLTLRPPCPSP